MANRTLKIDTRLRAEEIWAMRMRGMSAAAIANERGMKLRAVYYYLQKHDRLISFQLKKRSSAVIARQFFSQSSHRQRELWKLHASTKDDSVKAQCLKLLGQEDDRMIAVGQSLGVVPKTPEKHEHSGPDGQPLAVVLDTGYAPKGVVPESPLLEEGPNLILDTPAHGNGQPHFAP